MAVGEARVGEAPDAAESGIPEERLVKAVGGPSTDRCGCCRGGEDGDAPRHRADAESTPDRFHAHHGADPIRATQGEVQGQPSAERRVHHVRGVDAEAVVHFGDPSGLVVGVADRCSVHARPDVADGPRLPRRGRQRSGHRRRSAQGTPTLPDHHGRSLEAARTVGASGTTSTSTSKPRSTSSSSRASARASGPASSPRARLRRASTTSSTERSYPPSRPR